VDSSSELRSYININVDRATGFNLRVLNPELHEVGDAALGKERRWIPATVITIIRS